MLFTFGRFWAQFVCRFSPVILLLAIAWTFIAVRSASQIAISTNLEALMPQGARSVQTLNDALRKTGSFASIQIVARSEQPEAALDYVKAVKEKIDLKPWVASSQYSEDIEVLEQHKLLLLSLEELLELEEEVKYAYPTLIAKEISKGFSNVPVTFTLTKEGVSGYSGNELDQKRLEELSGEVAETPPSEQLFVSKDQKTVVLVVWPKQGLESLTDAKRMVDDAKEILAATPVADSGDAQMYAAVAGRIANKVAQFDAIIGDVKFGLLGAMTLISLVIVLSFRSFIVLPVVIIPLITGIVWTIGLTSATIGGLNLITIFLAIILFGLGIDFGIHNFSRYREERRNGKTIEAAMVQVVTNTGAASLIAALTTASGFYSLMLTDFRAFTEFGFIAGSGVLLVFVAMYTIFPALVVAFERLRIFGIEKTGRRLFTKTEKPAHVQIRNTRIVFGGACVLLLASLFFAPKVDFERNFKNLEAKQPEALSTANSYVTEVFPDGHDRAIIVVKTQEELAALDDYFKELILTDHKTPTIKKVASLIDFLPDQDKQQQRLEVIGRLNEKAEALQSLEPSRYSSVKRYLSIDDLNLIDLPETIKRTFIGTDSEPGYLMYVFNSVSMNDSAEAKKFYDDAAKVTLGETEYYSASEGFIFVEMIALMKADAVKAISLVTLTTALLVIFFIRSFWGSIIVLIPPLLGVLVTVGFMGAFGPRLSIMNMVILPSLIGISVDNSIHIFHRFAHDLPDADVPDIMNNTGRAAVLTTLTTLFGFGGMVTASMGGLRSMGILAIIGFIACLIMTWSLLPVMLEAYQRRVRESGDVPEGYEEVMPPFRAGHG